ncbi:MAG TPA: thiamine phosphate synthase [Candidatus Acidoferrales bacterium]|nr:thiamine phosphate synthase [Candidatus Acidoferrales bacterium]
MPWPSPRTRGPLAFYVTDRRAFASGEPRDTSLLLDTIARAAAAGVDAIQLREKDLSSRALLELTQAALSCASHSKILVNDRLDVALAAGASGVHLGEQSIAVADVVSLRAAGRAPADFAIGRSCHSLEEVSDAERAGADYVFFGPVFATPSKAKLGPPQGAETLAAVCRAARIPVVAIGGITVENAAACLAAGAAGIAAIRLFQEAADLTAVVRALQEL